MDQDKTKFDQADILDFKILITFYIGKKKKTK